MQLASSLYSGKSSLIRFANLSEDVITSQSWHLTSRFSKEPVRNLSVAHLALGYCMRFSMSFHRPNVCQTNAYPPRVPESRAKYGLRYCHLPRVKSGHAMG